MPKSEIGKQVQPLSRKEKRKLARFAKRQESAVDAGPPPVNPAPSQINRLATFIEHPLLCVAGGVGIGVLLMTYPIPALLLCFVLVLVAAKRSGIVSSESLFKQILLWLVIIVPTASALWFVLLRATPWELQRSNPLFLDARVTSPGYVSGTLYAGLKWEPEYKEFTINIDNKSGYSIERAEFELKVDNGIDVMGAAQADGIASCRFSPSKAVHDGDSFSFDVNPEATRLGKQGTITPLVPHPSREDMVCDRLPADTGNRVILALRGNVPSILVVTGSYDLVDGEKLVRKTVDFKKHVKAY